MSFPEAARIPDSRGWPQKYEDHGIVGRDKNSLDRTPFTQVGLILLGKESEAKACDLQKGHRTGGGGGGGKHPKRCRCLSESSEPSQGCLSPALPRGELLVGRQT